MTPPSITTAPGLPHCSMNCFTLEPIVGTEMSMVQVEAPWAASNLE